MPRGRKCNTHEELLHLVAQVERKLTEVELDRTLCMNRIAQLEEELDSIKETKAEAMTDARLNNEFLGRGFSDLQVLLETGFKQLEKFYLETGTGTGAGEPSMAERESHGENERGGEKQYRNAVEETMAHLREETSAAIE